MNQILLWMTTSLCVATSVLAQQTSLTPTDRQQTITATFALLDKQYVFPEQVPRMRQYVNGQKRIYDTISTGNNLARQLTRDLQAASHDKHLNVSYWPNGVANTQLWNKAPSPEQQAAQQAFLRKMLVRENFGILQLSVLKGNLGYISFKVLAPPEVAGPSYVAAMNYLAQTDALIIDLRECNGAISEHAIPFLCSYFFAKPTHLNDLYWREGDRTLQSWTYAQVQGQHYGSKPIYILISAATFSGAEELAYDLKSLKRATIVGDTTGGGANPGGTLRINEHFAAFVPNGRAINPITKSNWEGIGVIPDTLVRSSLALYTAQRVALQSRLKQADLPADEQGYVKYVLTELERNAPRFTQHTFTLTGYPNAQSVHLVGSFNGWSTRATPMLRRGNAWVAGVDVEPGKVSYKFIVDGQWITDPANPRTEGQGQFTNSLLEVANK